MTYFCKMESPVGLLTVASDGTSVTGLWIDGQKYFASKLGVAEEAPELPVFKQVKEWMDCYFSGKEPDFMPPLAPEGSEFGQSVWKLLRQIPYGHLMTYGEIAGKLVKLNSGKRMSAQAVGGAVGHNPISILIPCHRVVGAKGNLTGYAGGISLKIQLLELEHVPMDDLFVPKKGTAL